MEHFRISDFSDDNKPRERLSSVGAASLTDYELLAILLGSGTKTMNVIELSQTILKRCGGLNGLRRITAEELQEIPGVGPAKTAGILAAIELGRRFAKAIRRNSDRVHINTAEDIYETRSIILIQTHPVHSLPSVA